MQNIQLKRNNTLMRKWVPKWLGGLMFFFLFFPIMIVSGAYSSTAGEMVAGLGIISENIQFSNFVSAVGMAVFAQILIPILRMHRPKMTYVIGFVLLYILSIICAKTTSMPLLFISCFFMGGIRILLVFTTIFTMLDYLSGLNIMELMMPEVETAEEIAKKDRFKSLALPIVYLIFVSIGQLGSTLTVWLAYQYEWQYVYWFMCGLVLIALLLVIILMKYQPRRKGTKIKWTYSGDIMAATLMLASGCFVLIYGKTFDWFDSVYIKLATILFILSTVVLIFLTAYSKESYIKREIITSKRVMTALLFFFLLMVLNSSSMLINAFTGVSMKLDNYQSASISNWSFVGYLIGGIAAFIMTKKNVSFRYMFAVGFGVMTLSAVYMYFQYQSMGLYENMIFPVIARSTGMIMLYALCGTFGMLGLNMNRLLGSWVFLMIAVRSIIGPVVGTAIYSNALNERTQHYIVRLSQNVDRMNPEITTSYDATRMGMMMQGKSYEEAEQMAALSTKGRIQMQATLAALKEITGWTIFAGVGCTLLALVYPYERRRKKIEKCRETEMQSFVIAP